MRKTCLTPTRRRNKGMSNALIIHIETATDICSVAISRGEKLLALKESAAERNHASLLSTYIRECMKEAGTNYDELDAVAVSKGPGSYTGLRIGVSTAKGLAYARDKKLLSCGTLENMAHAALENKELASLVEKYSKKLLLCPMLDARRMEVYSAFYDTDLKLRREVAADIIDESSYRSLLEEGPVVFFGNGAPKCREMLQHKNAHFVEELNPSAAAMIRPVLEREKRSEYENVAYFEPYYLKDFVATIPKKKVL